MTDSPRIDRRQVLIGGALTALATGSGVLPRSALADDWTPGPLSLWYRQPANEWVQALPVGNGRLGAMVFGGIANERIALNEDSFFAGGPYDPTNPEAAGALAEVRRLIFAGKFAEAQQLANDKVMAKPLRQMSYQTIGDLLLTAPGIENASGYVRELDLDTAVARTQFDTGSTRFVREVFASAVDHLLVVRWSASAIAASGNQGRVSASITLATPQRGQIAFDGDDTLVMTGVGPAENGVIGAVKFEARAQLRISGGRVTAGDGLFVSNASEIVLLISLATNVRGPNDLGADPSALNRERIAAAGKLSYADLLNRHVADHRRMFGRVSFDLGTTEALYRPTDERVREFARSNDPALVSLYFQYGRYLLMASSRPGSQPANLQGIWNERTNPPWQSKWTINVNTEMNYWPADMAALGECVEPLMRMVKELSVSGAKVARTMYGARGWMAHHNTDLWRAAAPIDGAQWGLWPMGGAWLLQNLWDHWEFSRDRAFLAELWPLMKGACEFYFDTLVEHPTEHVLVTNPSLSPENPHPYGSTLCAGPAMDSQLLRDLFDRSIEAARLLDVDAEFRQQAAATRARLPADRIGKAGQLQEWMEDWDMDVPEIRHRHISHLYAVHPSEQITLEDTPELAKAARRSLEIRGDDATGWGIAWRICQWARFAEGDHAFEVIRMLLTPQRTYPNLFDAHPPFQIDGNFGAAAGIGEMLLQSHRRRLKLLPALPRAWSQGRVTGLRARGGFEIDLFWSQGVLERVNVRSLAGESATLIYGGASIALALRKGGQQSFTWSKEKLVKA